MAHIEDGDFEKISALKERFSEIRKKHNQLYDRLPAEQRVQVRLAMREFDRRLRRLAKAKEFYEGDKAATDQVRKRGTKLGVFALVFGAGWLLAEWADLIELERRTEWIFVAAAGTMA